MKKGVSFALTMRVRVKGTTSPGASGEARERPVRMSAGGGAQQLGRIRRPFQRACHFATLAGYGDCLRDYSTKANCVPKAENSGQGYALL